uniref:Mitotic arrest deficient 2 like 1 n=1 Tax=Pundamilia nyererei TaxID=303518 RepID=A0A3B4GJP2_9CICH
MTSTLKGITLKGSAELVAEFFSFGINSILYQRGIYPPETFTRVTHYDLSLLLTTDPKLKSYLTNVVSQLKVIYYINCFELQVPQVWTIRFLIGSTCAHGLYIEMRFCNQCPPKSLVYQTTARIWE